MKCWIQTDGTFEDVRTVETFEATGHRDTKKSAHLDAMKVAAAWGYHKYDGYKLVTEDGKELKIVDPYRDSKWLKVMHKDYLHIVGAKT